jgi:hypothetical protein
VTSAHAQGDDEHARGAGGVCVCVGHELLLRKRRQSVRCRNSTKKESRFEKGIGGARGQEQACPSPIMELEPITQICDELVSSRLFCLVGLAEKKPMLHKFD